MRTRIGVGIYTAVCIFLVICKAVGTLDWSWAAVLAPIWVPVLLAVALAFTVLVLAAALAAIGG